MQGGGATKTKARPKKADDKASEMSLEDHYSRLRENLVASGGSDGSDSDPNEGKREVAEGAQQLGPDGIRELTERFQQLKRDEQIVEELVRKHRSSKMFCTARGVGGMPCAREVRIDHRSGCYIKTSWENCDEKHNIGFLCKTHYETARKAHKKKCGLSPAPPSTDVKRELHKFFFEVSPPNPDLPAPAPAVADALTEKVKQLEEQNKYLNERIEKLLSIVRYFAGAVEATTQDPHIVEASRQLQSFQ